MSYTLSIPDLAKLTRRTARREAGVFLVEGKKIVEEAAKTGNVLRQVMMTEKFRQQNPHFLVEHGLETSDLTIIAEHSAQRLADTTTPPGIFAVVELPKTELTDLETADMIVAFDNIRDPGNLGTMLRTATWFGAKAALISANGADVYNEKVMRASMGSVFQLKIVDSDNFAGDLARLKDAGYTIVVTRPEVKTNFVPKKGQKICLVMGNESVGTSEEVDELADAAYSIPRYGNTESLNVSVSFGIVMNELVREIF